MEKLIKDNILYILIVVIAFVGGVYLVYNFGTRAYNNISELNVKKNELVEKQQRLEQIRAQKLSNSRHKESNQEQNKATKVIYEVLGQQFSREASFGIMFDNMLTNMTNNGLKIRSIDYNYDPVDDKILEAKNEGYNACELAFVVLGTYTQLQNFFKNLAKEDYLTSINEVYLVPYDKDKSILVARFKIRLYTKTI